VQKTKFKSTILLNSQNTLYLSKIGGGQRVEKFEIGVIKPFIIDAPLNISNIKMCEFVDHLECLNVWKNTKNSDICCAMYLCII